MSALIAKESDAKRAVSVIVIGSETDNQEQKYLKL
jgi:hypothetical protein